MIKLSYACRTHRLRFITILISQCILYIYIYIFYYIFIYICIYGLRLGFLLTFS